MRYSVFIIFTLVFFGNCIFCFAEGPSIAVIPIINLSNNSTESITDSVNSMINNAVIESRLFTPIDHNLIIQAAYEFRTQQNNGVSYENTIIATAKRVRAKLVLSGTYLIEYRQGSDYNTITLKLQISDTLKSIVYKNIDVKIGSYFITDTIESLSKRLSDLFHEINYGDLYLMKNNRKANVHVVIKAENTSCAMEGHTKAVPVDLTFFNEKISDYHFLVSQIERIIGQTNVNYEELGPKDSLDDLSPKAISEADAIIFVKLNRGGKIHTFSRESEHWVKVNIECIHPKSLNVTGTSTLSTRIIKGKKNEVFPEIKSDLVENLLKEWKPFPFEF